MKTNDDFGIWVSCGLCGALAKDVYSFLAEVLHFSHYFIWNIAADIFVDNKSALNSFWGYVLGGCTDFFIGALLGIVICFVLKSSSTYGLLKAVIIALTAWLLFFGAYMHVFSHVFTARPLDPASYVSSFIAHCVFGSAVYIAYRKLAKPG